MIGLHVVLASRPEGMPVPENFRLEEVEVPAPAPGQLLLAVKFASADPYMRTKMIDVESYTPPYQLDAVISARTVCEIEESRDPRYQAGDLVSAYTGWQTHAVVEADAVVPVDTLLAPPSAFLGVLGMPGFTAYCGLEKIGRPLSGETLVVAAALGPVGATVAQMARLRGLHVVAVVGGDAKATILREEFGIDTVLDHRSPSFADDLAAATPEGIDIYFENVGGHVADAVLPRMNLYGRVPLCGMVADYNRVGTADGPDRLPGFYRHVLVKSLDVRGFLSSEFDDELHDAFIRDMSAWVRNGDMVHREHVTDGLASAPAALIRMLRGDNVGKTVIKIT
jgi:NADPH-dependent curcumin reductase CurA